jgi:hypothetical protein
VGSGSGCEFESDVIHARRQKRKAAAAIAEHANRLKSSPGEKESGVRKMCSSAETLVYPGNGPVVDLEFATTSRSSVIRT